MLVDGKKIAGILIEARIQEDRVYLLIGTGVNVEPVEDEHAPECDRDQPGRKPRLRRPSRAPSGHFVRAIDEGFSNAFGGDEVLAKWRELSVQNPGDQIHCVIGERTIRGPVVAHRSSTAAPCWRRTRGPFR